jgi:hypothetical protein
MHVQLAMQRVKAYPPGTYYYCSTPNCPQWYGTRQPPPDYQCPHCEAEWQNATGVVVREIEGPGPVPELPQERSCTSYVIGGLLLLTAGCLAYYAVVPAVSEAWLNFQIAWANFVEGVLTWLEFIGSGLLYFGVVSGGTVLLVGLFAALIYVFTFLVLSLASPVSVSETPQPAWRQTGQILGERGRLIGTLTNLFSSLCALLIVSWWFERPPDYWDFGIQFLIALIIEFLVFRWFQ